jgi:hypothetical protein
MTFADYIELCEHSTFDWYTDISSNFGITDERGTLRMFQVNASILACVLLFLRRNWRSMAGRYWHQISVQHPIH